MSMTTRKLASAEDELHQAAIDRTGADDFGDPAYRQGLRALLEAFDTDLQLTATGWQVAHDMVLRLLIARLYTERGWSAHPEVHAVQIDRPLVIVGLPRTGTTALHKLLSMDSQFQGLEYWLTGTPMIRPSRETWHTLPEYRDCVANLEARYRRTPELLSAHEIVAGEVEECGRVLAQSFVFEPWTASLPTYARWFFAQSARESYHRYVDVLRLVGAAEPHKLWLLKGPTHTADIDALLEVFPDACIIQTHRDPIKAIASACSVLHMQVRDFAGEALPDSIGPWLCAYWRKALDRMQAARQKYPRQFLDVDHRRFVADPLGTVRSIYDYFGVVLSARTEQQMRAWVAASPTSRHGQHQYALDFWGVTHGRVCEMFADYRTRHQFN